MIEVKQLSTPPVTESALKGSQTHSQTAFHSSNAEVKALMFIWAFVNKIAFLMILVAASDIAHFFHQDRLLSLYHGSLVAFSFLAKVLHAKFLLRVPHKIKLFVITCVVIVGCLSMVSAVLSVNFELSLLATVLIGVCFALSETIVQGFVKSFDPTLIGPYGAGTGLTGLVVSAGYLVLKLYAIDLMFAFAALIPFVAANQLVFMRFIGLTTRAQQVAATPRLEVEESQAAINENLSLSNLWELLKLLRYYITVYFLYHVFVYGIFGVFGVEAVKQQTDHPQFLAYGYSALIVTYRVGSLLARSTLGCFQVARLHLPLAGLLVAYLLMISFAEGGPADPLALYVTLFASGFFEGLIYVNTIFGILHDESIAMSRKEAAISVNSLFFDLGVIASAVIGVIYLKTKQF